MKPIINPWLFYFIDKAEEISEPLFIIGLLSWAGFIALLVLSTIGDEDSEKLFKRLKIPRILITIGLIIAMLLPSKETGYKMLAASMATPDNITAVGETAENIIDYIVESVDILLEDNGE